MWTKTYSKIYVGVDKEALWRLWEDVNNWPAWDHELEYCKMDQDFVAGTDFILKPKGGPKVKIVLSKVVPQQRFEDYCDFFGARMYDDHVLEDTDYGLRISNTITVTGFLSFLWVRLVAKKVALGAPQQLDRLVELAKKTVNTHG